MFNLHIPFKKKKEEPESMNILFSRNGKFLVESLPCKKFDSNSYEIDVNYTEGIEKIYGILEPQYSLKGDFLYSNLLFKATHLNQDSTFSNYGAIWIRLPRNTSYPVLEKFCKAFEFAIEDTGLSLFQVGYTLLERIIEDAEERHKLELEEITNKALEKI